jgi:hypothetical protein
LLKGVVFLIVLVVLVGYIKKLFSNEKYGSHTISYFLVKDDMEYQLVFNALITIRTFPVIEVMIFITADPVSEI